jgi:hypothetical protein
MTDDAFNSTETTARLRRFFGQCVSRRGDAERIRAGEQAQLVRVLVDRTLAAAALRLAVRRGDQQPSGTEASAWHDALSVEALTRCRTLRS